MLNRSSNDKLPRLSPPRDLPCWKVRDLGGKGYLEGFGEEFGFVGGVLLLVLYLFIMGRALFITLKAQNTFCRLLAGSLALTFFLSFFVNIGMVSGIIPVVGVPLPLVSYGGTSMVTLLANFGILMSIHTHRKLVTT